ncbi:MAG: arylesterase [Desulfobacteraceae bacterium]|nr:MAG: arylesterase [Desulfobacteraceae bacterium]
MNKHPLHRPAPFISFIAAILIVLEFVCLTGCGGESSSDEAASNTPVKTKPIRGTIVAMGDSLTAGLGVDETEAYPARLEKKLAAEGYDFKVVNAGVSGETSSGALSRIDWVISSLKPDLIILETGANDGLRGIEPDVLRKNLDRIVSAIKAEDIAVILCGMKMPANLGPVYTQAFIDIYPEIAQKHAILLIPFFLEGVAGDPRYNQPDRMHPTAEGYRRIVDHIYPYVLTIVKKRKELCK